MYKTMEPWTSLLYIHFNTITSAVTKKTVLTKKQTTYKLTHKTGWLLPDWSRSFIQDLAVWIKGRSYRTCKGKIQKSIFYNYISIYYVMNSFDSALKSCFKAVNFYCIELENGNFETSMEPLTLLFDINFNFISLSVFGK